jgi:DNA-binding transcriptional regulator YiaG
MLASVTENANAVLDAMRRLVEEYDRAAVAIAEMTDPQAAFEVATAVADKLRAVAEDAARLRAAQVVRIRDTESMSLARLAEVLGVSKARADQLTRMGTEETPPATAA